MTDLPRGTIDLHVHLAPDGGARTADVLEFARGAAGGAGRGPMGAVLKGHLAPTGAVAKLVHREVPDFALFGSVVLNHAVGGLNPSAVEALAQVGGASGRYVWLPTRDAGNDMARKERTGRPVRVVEDGRPVTALHDVAAVARSFGMVLASGHLAPPETVVVFRALARSGLTLVATHVTAPVTDFGEDELRAVFDAGAVAEICARNLLVRRADLAEPAPDRVIRAAGLVRRFGASRFVLSSDLGASVFPAPATGLAAVAAALARSGVSDADLEEMLVTAPRRIVGADNVECSA